MIFLQEKETAQETFDFVIMKLREQGKPAMADKVCVYGEPKGCRCAVGHLMGDQRYTGAGGSIKTLVEYNEVNQPKYYSLISEMQRAHDFPAVENENNKKDWQTACAIEMIKVAERHNLSPQSAKDWLNSIR